MYQAVSPDNPEKEAPPPYEIVSAQMAACDLCGKNGNGEIYQTSNFNYLCPNCFKHLSASDGKIKACIERWLTGNVI